MMQCFPPLQILNGELITTAGMFIYCTRCRYPSVVLVTPFHNEGQPADRPKDYEQDDDPAPAFLRQPSPPPPDHHVDFVLVRVALLVALLPTVARLYRLRHDHRLWLLLLLHRDLNLETLAGSHTDRHRDHHRLTIHVHLDLLPWPAPRWAHDCHELHPWLHRPAAGGDLLLAHAPRLSAAFSAHGQLFLLRRYHITPHSRRPPRSVQERAH
jgi:hypothetical protein